MKPQKSEKKHYHSHTRNVIISPQNAHEKVQQHIQEFPPQHRLPDPSPIPGEVMFTWTNLTSFQKIEYCRESWVTVWMSRSRKFWIGLNLSVIMMGLRSNSSWASDKKLFMASDVSLWVTDGLSRYYNHERPFSFHLSEHLCVCVYILCRHTQVQTSAGFLLLVSEFSGLQFRGLQWWGGFCYKLAGPLMMWLTQSWSVSQLSLTSGFWVLLYSQTNDQPGRRWLSIKVISLMQEETGLICVSKVPSAPSKSFLLMLQTMFMS